LQELEAFRLIVDIQSIWHGLYGECQRPVWPNEKMRAA
jgi:hypothetical protein